MRDRRDWRGVLRDGRFQGFRAFGWGLLLITAVFGLGTLAAAGLSKAGVPKEGAGELLRIAIITGVLFGTYVLMVRLGERRSVRELALRPALPEVTAGLTGGIVLFSLVMCILLAMHAYTIAGPHPSSPLRPLAQSISSGVAEELAFRGVFMRLMWEALGLRVALVSSAVLFGLAHLANPGHNLTGPLFIIIEAGITLSALYALSGRLWLCMGAHAGWNFAQGFLFGAEVSATDFHGHFWQVAPNPEASVWLTGGSFGPEASLPALVIGGATGIALLIWIRHRRRGDVVPAWA